MDSSKINQVKRRLNLIIQLNYKYIQYLRIINTISF